MKALRVSQRLRRIGERFVRKPGVAALETGMRCNHFADSGTLASFNGWVKALELETRIRRRKAQVDGDLCQIFFLRHASTVADW